MTTAAVEVKETADIMEVGSALASSWLKSNTRNRTLSEKTVNQYVADMRNRKWHPAASVIQFDTEGRLIDGQHRLTAVVKSGVPQKFIVRFGVNPRVQDVVDTQNARKFSDTLVIEGLVDKNSGNYAAATKFCMMYEEGVMLARGGKKYTIAEQREWLENNPALVEHVKWVINLKVTIQGITRPHLAMLIYEAKGLEDKAKEFIEQYASGANLNEGDPALALITRMRNVQASNNKLDRSAYPALLIKAFNSYASGKSLKTVKWARGGQKQESFPSILTAADIK